MPALTRDIAGRMVELPAQRDPGTGVVTNPQFSLDRVLTFRKLSIGTRLPTLTPSPMLLHTLRQHRSYSTSGRLIVHRQVWDHSSAPGPDPEAVYDRAVRPLVRVLDLGVTISTTLKAVIMHEHAYA